MADDDKSLGGLWKNFRENSSAHGIPRTSTATSMVRRVMWSLLFLGACAYFIYNFHGILVKYFSYPVVTNVEIDSKPEIKFPAVAICNLNAVRRSKRNLTDAAPQENRRKKREADTFTSTEVSVATTFSSTDGVSGNTEATSGTSTSKEPESTSDYDHDMTTSLTGKTTTLITTTLGGDADNSTKEMKTTSSMFSEPINNVTATTGITDAGMISTEQDTVNTTLGTRTSPGTVPEQTSVSSNTTTGIAQVSPTSTVGSVTEVPSDDATRMSSTETTVYNASETLSSSSSSSSETLTTSSYTAATAQTSSSTNISTVNTTTMGSSSAYTTPPETTATLDALPGTNSPSYDTTVPQLTTGVSRQTFGTWNTSSTNTVSSNMSTDSTAQWNTSASKATSNMSTDPTVQWNTSASIVSSNMSTDSTVQWNTSASIVSSNTPKETTSTWNISSSNTVTSNTSQAQAQGTAATWDTTVTKSIMASNISQQTTVMEDTLANTTGSSSSPETSVQWTTSGTAMATDALKDTTATEGTTDNAMTPEILQEITSTDSSTESIMTSEILQEISVTDSATEIAVTSDILQEITVTDSTTESAVTSDIMQEITITEWETSETNTKPSSMSQGSSTSWTTSSANIVSLETSVAQSNTSTLDSSVTPTLTQNTTVATLDASSESNMATNMSRGTTLSLDTLQSTTVATSDISQNTSRSTSDAVVTTNVSKETTQTKYTPTETTLHADNASTTNMVREGTVTSDTSQGTTLSSHYSSLSTVTSNMSEENTVSSPPDNNSTRTTLEETASTTIRGDSSSESTGLSSTLHGADSPSNALQITTIASATSTGGNFSSNTSPQTNLSSLTSQQTTMTSGMSQQITTTSNTSHHTTMTPDVVSSTNNDHLAITSQMTSATTDTLQETSSKSTMPTLGTDSLNTLPTTDISTSQETNSRQEIGTSKIPTSPLQHNSTLNGPVLTTAVAETSSKSVKVSGTSSEEPSKWEEATTPQSTRETTEPLSTTTFDYEYYDTEDPAPPGEILAVDEESLPLSVSYEKAQNFSALLASLNTTIRNEMGHDKQDFIQECTFNGRICSPEEDFVTILDETYGNCFIFNSGQTRGGAFWTAKQSGPLHGLQLTLFLDPDEYLSDLTPAAGARLLIHEHTQYPFAGEEGISLPPGYTVSIGLSQTLLERKGGNYGPCTDGKDKGFYRLKNGSDIRLFPESYSYSVKLCEKTCLQQQIVERCGCADPYIKIPDNEVPCHPKDPCRTVFKKLYQNGSLQCDCPAACRETIFSSSVGFGEWPAPLYTETFIDDMMNKHGTGFGNLGTAAEVREGFIQVTVYFENMNIEHIYETPSYEVENLLGDIGGQLGLWMGISIMTVIELAEFLTDVVLLLLYRRKKSAQPDVEADLPRNPDAGLPGLRRGPAAGLSGLPRGPADGLTGFPRGTADGLTGFPRGTADGLAGFPRGPAAGPPGSQFILLPRDFPMSRIVPNYPVMKGSWRNNSFTDV